jgi:diamine N-acetyltransferase
MTITYRTPTATDIPALARLGAETFMDTFGHLYSEQDSAAFLRQNHSIEQVAANMSAPDMAYFVAEAANNLIGYCKIGALDLPCTPTGNAQELHQMYVHSDYKGQGVAQQLMTWALDTFRSRAVDEVYLSVWSENPRAQRFYQNYGFEQVGINKFMVGQQADHDFIYRLSLKS